MRIKLLVKGIQDCVSDVGIEIGDADDEQLVQDFRNSLHRGRAEDARVKSRLASGNLNRLAKTVFNAGSIVHIYNVNWNMWNTFKYDNLIFCQMSMTQSRSVSSFDCINHPFVKPNKSTIFSISSLTCISGVKSLEHVLTASNRTSLWSDPKKFSAQWRTNCVRECP